MSKTSLIIYLIIALLLVYFAQDVLYVADGVFPQLILVIYLVICSIYLVKILLSKNRASIASILLLFILVLGFYMSVSTKVHYTSLGTAISAIAHYKAICLALMTFFPFYYLSRSKHEDHKPFKLLFIAYFIIAILQFYSQAESIIEELGSDDAIVNNTAYSFVLLLPYLGLYTENRKFSVAMMLACLFFIILGAKRGAIVCGFAGVAIYFYYWFMELRHSRRVSNIAMFILLLFISVSVTYYFVEQDLFLLERFTQLSEGNSSSRNIIYSTIWNYWLSSDNPFHMIFGYGFNASFDIVGVAAHNDWLELLSSTGLLGVGIYFAFFVSFWKFAKSNSVSANDRTVLMMIFTIWSIKSMFSMGYNDEGMFLITALMGHIIGKNDVQQKTFNL